ncbi:poly(U)-specific 3'-to-5' RNA exonuclease [Lambiella insularis]|nr:poly(U)-specific 3'-to-5' RNA exonuclease [Lambiella insularis]
MPLVNYSDSDDSDHGVAPPMEPTVTRTIVERQISPSLKRKRSKASESDLPPLPDAFHDLYASTSRVSTQDDPSLHGGRQRATPHVEGNWPTHVYIECLLGKLNHEPLSEGAQIQSLLKSELGADLPLHISLSRSLTLLSNERQLFLVILVQSLEKISIRPFEVHVNGWKWEPNFEKTRWFLVLQLARPSADSLNMLLWASNQTALALGKPTLYATPERTPRESYGTFTGVREFKSHQGRGEKGRPTPNSRLPQVNSITDCSSMFHVSIAWSHQPPTSDMLLRTSSVSTAEIEGLRIPVRTLKAKIGNAVTALSLSASLHEYSGIIGA